MPREYRHIKQYEKEIIELWEQGVTLRKIAERLDLQKSKYRNSKRDIILNKENLRQE